jgi:ketosteroid isomerase-like protein
VSSVEETIKQMEHDWVTAERAADAGWFERTFANDWSGWSSSGTRESKKEYVANVRTGLYRVQSLEFGPMDVTVVGDVAICQGSNTEKSTYDGKDTSGTVVWMDVYVHRDGAWKVLRSQIARRK